MNDPQLIERLAVTDLYRNDASLPETMRSDIVLLEIARRMDMATDTKERVEVVRSPRQRWNGALIAAAAFALVIIVGLAAVLLTNSGPDAEPANPPTTIATQDIDVNAADPVQATHDQSRRVTINFAGNAQILAEGGAHSFEVELHLDGTEGLGGRDFTVTYTSTDGVIATTGTNEAGEEVTARWSWFADDGLLVTLLSQNLPDTRPEVTVSVQETPTSPVIEFVMDSPAP